MSACRMDLAVVHTRVLEPKLDLEKLLGHPAKLRARLRGAG